MKRLKVFLLASILLLGFLLRFHHYDRFPRHGATFDEFAWTWQGISLWQTGVPTSWSPHSHYPHFELKKFQGAWVRLVTPYLEHPPLFGLLAGGFALLTGSKNLFDITLSQIRILSLIIGVTTIFLVYLLAKKLYGQKVGLLAALLYATIPTLVIGSRILQNDNFFVLAFLSVWLLLLEYLKTKKPWQRNLAAIFCGLLTLAKVPWATATIAVCLLLTKEKRWKDCFLVGLIALAFFSLFFFYGRHYDWPTFISLWGLQTARAKIGLGSVLALFTHPYLVDRIYPDGWIYFGWLSIAVLSLKFKKHAKLLIPFLAYFLVFVLAVPGIEAQGWYRYAFYPFLTIAAAVLIDKIINKPGFFNLIFFFLVASSAFHWGWEEVFGISNSLFRATVLLGTASFLPGIFWPKQLAKLTKRATVFWLAVFVILNIISVLNHVHS
jgi:4-amino-4-deoxy-L-arabinose transferase-like glycosyltransferase